MDLFNSVFYGFSMKLLVSLISLLIIGQSAYATPGYKEPPETRMCDYVYLELADAADRDLITMDQADDIYDNCMDMYGYTIDPTQEQCNCINQGIYD